MRHTLNLIELFIAILLLCGMATLYHLSSSGPWEHLTSWAMVTQSAIIIITGIILVFFNKKYNVTRNQGMAPSIIFLLLCASFPWSFASLDLLPIPMALLSLITLWILFSAVGKDFSSYQMFTVASILSVASMFQYGFAFLAIVFLVIAIILHIMDFRSLLGYMLGLMTPYACGLGLDIFSLDMLRMPQMRPIFLPGMTPEETIAVPVYLVAVALMMGLISVTNAMRLYSAKRSSREYHRAIAVLGLSLVILMILDFTNILAYTTTLFLVTGIECGYVINASRNVVINGWLILIAAITIGFGIFSAFML